MDELVGKCSALLGVVLRVGCGMVDDVGESGRTRRRSWREYMDKMLHVKYGMVDGEGESGQGGPCEKKS